ncbi:hypothetical protein AB1Y20_021574 [Prymnesium parvum]|uniref:Transmembrane protein n=1 Tax=Prymnesium parvum TaxID=97485 RepID=A0AB34JML7_PRYPA
MKPASALIVPVRLGIDRIKSREMALELLILTSALIFPSSTLTHASALLTPHTLPRMHPIAPLARGIILMQAGDSPEGKPSEAVEVGEATEAKPQTGGYETFYDDEKDTAPEKPALSDAMRQRLLNEQRGLGADANSKNPFLLVFAGVGVFVLLGALAVSL